MAQSVEASKRAAQQAQRAQVAAWSRWQETDTVEDMAAWSRAVDAQRVAEEAAADAADRWEATEASRDTQADWWVAAMSNARAA